MTDLTGEQAEAGDAIVQWYREFRVKSLTLGGYAGTGKTTLIGELPRLLKLPLDRIVFASFTGKAVSVMKNKLPPGAHCSTLHRLLYRPRQKMICIESGEDAIEVGVDGQWYCYSHHPQSDKRNAGNEPCEVRKSLDWSPVIDPLEDYELVVVDEASMVSLKLWEDLTRWGVPVLAVGDHGQLDPIGSDFNLMSSPDIRLETIMRQAQDNPIIRMATLARLDGHIPIGDYGWACVKLPPFKQGAAVSRLHPEKGDFALCATNRTRNSLNTRLRRQMLVTARTPDPVIGDIVICLRNSYEAGIFNGLRGRILDLGPESQWVDTHGSHPQRFAAISLLDDDYEFHGEIATEQFNQLKTQNDISRRLTLWDYGYALTVHKAQGSETDRVLVVEERIPRWDHRRWLYTAVTRARRSLCVVGPASPQ